MLRLSNIGCGLAAALLLGSSGAELAIAQADDAAVSFVTPHVPDAAGVVSAHSSVRRWVDRLEAPRMDDASSRLEIRDCAGVCVIVRRQGKPIGIGVDAGGDALMVRRAAGRALNQAMGDGALSRVAAKLHEIAEADAEDLALDDSIREDLGRRLTVEIEAAGQMVPLTGRDLSQLARKIVPGLDGVAVRRGDQWTMLFPTQLRATNKSADSEKLMLYLSIQAGVPMRAIAQLDALPDVTFYSFRTVHLAQAAPQRAPLSLTRGDTFASLGGNPRERIERFTDDLARSVGQLVQFEHQPNAPLEGQANKGPLQGLAGNYQPWIDQYEGTASALEQALVSWSLLSYANLEGADGELRARSVEIAIGLLETLELREPGGLDEPAACAAIVYAVAARPEILENESIRRTADRAADCVTRSFEPAAGFLRRSPEQSHAASLDSNTQSMLAAAMARMLTVSRLNPARNDPQLVRQAIDAAWQAVAEPERVALLPWIGWAESDWMAATGQPSPRLGDLRQLVAMLNNLRVGSTAVQGRWAERDLTGGFVLRTAVQSAADVVRPTSQTARPAAWLSTAMRDTQLVADAGREEAIRGHLETVRFLIQLTVREDCATQFPNARRASGGIRAALWDSTQPVAAQALGLVAGVETLHSLEQLQP